MPARDLMHNKFRHRRHGVIFGVETEFLLFEHAQSCLTGSYFDLDVHVLRCRQCDVLYDFVVIQCPEQM